MAADKNAEFSTEDKTADPFRIDPLFNPAFIRVFGSPSSKEFTRTVLNIILREAGLDEIGPIDQISAEHTAVEGTVGKKNVRFDVHVVTEEEEVDLEAERHEGSIVNRSLLYLSRMLSLSMTRSESYGDLPRVIVVVIADADAVLDPGGDIVSSAQMVWDFGTPQARVCSDRLELVTVDLKTARECYDSLEEAERGGDLAVLLYLLANGYRYKDEVGQIMGKLPSLSEFERLYGDAIGDKSLQKAYEEYQYDIMERNRHKEYLRERERQIEEKARKVVEARKAVEEARKAAEEARKAAEEARKTAEEARKTAEEARKAAEEARERGLEEGRLEGREEGRAQLAEALRSLGVEESLLAKALEE